MVNGDHILTAERPCDNGSGLIVLLTFQPEESALKPGDEIEVTLHAEYSNFFQIDLPAVTKFTVSLSSPVLLHVEFAHLPDATPLTFVLQCNSRDFMAELRKMIVASAIFPLAASDIASITIAKSNEQVTTMADVQKLANGTPLIVKLKGPEEDEDEAMAIDTNDNEENGLVEEDEHDEVRTVPSAVLAAAAKRPKT